jgi:large subunit ribosomal protein L18
MINKICKNVNRVKRHQRIRKQISGTPECPRLSVFRSNKHIAVQVIDDVNQKTLVSSSTEQLHIVNGGNIEGSKLVGADIAKKCLAAGIETVVFDRGGYVYTGRIAALADAARENGLKF